MIKLKQLIQVAPFPEGAKKQLLEQVDSFSQEKQFELIETCWALISADYQNRLRGELQNATLEMAKGEKVYSKEDFKKMEDDLFLELTSKLDTLENQEEIEVVRKRLQEQNTTNL